MGPHILHIVCHDLGRVLGCCGAPVSTPALDRFGAGGAVFTNAFCSAPACSPSRACAMTGQHSHVNGVLGLTHRGWAMPAAVRTIVDEFNDHGYETLHVGFQHERRRAADNRYQVAGGDRREIYAEHAVPRAIQLLEARREAARPFYLNVGLMEVHASQWSGDKFPERRALYGAAPPGEVVVPAHLPDLPRVREELGHFQACIAFMDRQLGPLLEAVDRLGLADRTLVVFTTDHGICGMRAKGTLYDAGLETALLMRMPGTIAAGQRPEALIPNIDLAPTLLEAAGVPVPPRMQGRSFWPLLTGGAYAPNEALFQERNYHSDCDPMRAIRTPRFHYIRNFDPSIPRRWLPEEVAAVSADTRLQFHELFPERREPRPVEELYAVLTDPRERINLADRPEHSPLLAEFRGRLEAWMRETGDPLRNGPAALPKPAASGAS